MNGRSVSSSGAVALATASLAFENGIQTIVQGRPLESSHDHMPAEMFIHSRPDYHLDATSVQTPDVYLEERTAPPPDEDAPFATTRDSARAVYSAPVGAELGTSAARTPRESERS
jgi:hypothetical protein